MGAQRGPIHRRHACELGNLLWQPQVYKHQFNLLQIIPQLICCKIYQSHFPGDLDSEESACNTDSIPGWGRSSREGNGNPLQYSCLGNPLDRGAWRAALHGFAKSWTRLNNWTQQQWWLIHFVVQQKPTQGGNAIIVQLKTNNNKKHFLYCKSNFSLTFEVQGESGAGQFWTTTRPSWRTRQYGFHALPWIPGGAPHNSLLPPTYPWHFPLPWAHLPSVVAGKTSANLLWTMTLPWAPVAGTPQFCPSQGFRLT